MTVLVTGGAGYIGSHTVRALREAGQPVVVLDSMEYGRADAVIDAPLVVGDIHDAALVEQVCADHGVTSLVHFAAYKSVGESMENPTRYWHNNVDGTVTLVDAAIRQGVREVVFSSSCSVYGTPAEVPVVESCSDRAGERVRRDQGHGRADPALVRGDAWSALGVVALLQRRRCQLRRADR